jgi:hypothetical protein
MSLKVIGAGFGRTGTTSLKTALEKIGFAPCYNMVTLFKHQEEHLKLWKKAYVGKKTDWDRIYRGYTSAVSWPTAAFVEQLMIHYPKAKIILTVRDPDEWFMSASATLFPIALENRGRGINVFDVVFKDKDRCFEEDYAISVYKRHIDRMKEIIPPARLLVYDVKEGWEPLCRFLGVRIPEETFPYQNKRLDFLGSFSM